MAPAIAGLAGRGAIPTSQRHQLIAQVARRVMVAQPRPDGDPHELELQILAARAELREPGREQMLVAGD
jgi:hypothetical protein